jgi:hypothetical protein
MITTMLIVPRGSFSMDEPWNIPDGVAPVALRRATDGGEPRLATRVAVWWDDDCLSALFMGDDDGVNATYYVDDEPLYEEDVVEVFIAPATPTRYFEIEVNPLGSIFDAVIDSPDGVRATMSADRSWNAGVFTAIQRTPSHFATIVRIPFVSLGAAPHAGDRWRGNFFRIDRHPTRGSEFSAWCPTMKTPADFHVVAAFGELIFA